MITALLLVSHPASQVAQQLEALPLLQDTSKSPRERSSTLRQGRCRAHLLPVGDQCNTWCNKQGESTEAPEQKLGELPEHI